MLKTKFIFVKRLFLFSVFSLTLASCGSDLTDNEKMFTTELTSKEVSMERFATLFPNLYKRHYYNTGEVIFGISVK